MKIKSNEIIKVVTATALSIGIFSAAFIGGNHVAFAATTNKTITMPTVVATSSILPQTNAVPENYPNPVITVNEVEGEFSQKKSANALSKEQAAEIGARYIWEVLGENINGRTVEMSYNIFPSSTRTHWIGSVWIGSSRGDMLEFAIDAVSGERNTFVIVEQSVRCRKKPYHSKRLVTGIGTKPLIT